MPRFLFLILIAVASYCSYLPAQQQAENTGGPVVIEEPQWTALFERTSGWTGSDATYSIPFSGYDAPGNAADDSTMFVFGDTFIGEVDSNKARKNSKMIRNTIGILNTKTPLPEEITFYWNSDTEGQPEELFKADTPESSPGDWIWPMDGIRLGKRFYIYAIRLYDPPGVANFAINGVTLISFELDSDHNFINYRHVDTPLYYKGSDDVEIVIGQAVMPMTSASGNPHPDGYIYVYGPRNRPFNFKQMVVSRVLPGDIENFDYYEFWDGTSWQSDITRCAVLTDSISQEFSVSPLPDGRFLAIFEFGGWVCGRYANHLTGPFGPVQFLYDCPEDTMYSGGFVYNAKAHPHLSGSGDLLISYNVNTSDFFELYQNADTYRPRFVRYFIPGEPSAIEMNEQPGKKDRQIALAAYPNPFNSTTVLKYRVARHGLVRLAVYDSRGRLVRKLLSEITSPGLYSFTLSDRGQTGRSLASGVYYVNLKAAGQNESRKIVLVK